MSESTPADRQEQLDTVTHDPEELEAPDVPLEATDADVVEQAAATAPGQHEGGDAGSRPLETDAADAAEQAVVVELDEDERR